MKTNSPKLPSWYPAPIHKRRLSLQEWHDELKERVWVMNVIAMFKAGKLSSLNMGKGEMERIFLSMVSGYRLANKDPSYADRAVQPLDFSPICIDRGITIYQTVPFDGTNKSLMPILIDLDSEPKVVISELKGLLKKRNDYIYSGGTHRNNTPLEREENKSVKLKHKKFIKGNYSEVDANDWVVSKILDYIDLKLLWSVLKDIEYTDKFLGQELWTDESKIRTIESTPDKHIEKVTKPKAYALLTNTTVQQLAAVLRNQQVNS